MEEFLSQRKLNVGAPEDTDNSNESAFWEYNELQRQVGATELRLMGQMSSTPTRLSSSSVKPWLAM